MLTVDPGDVSHLPVRRLAPCELGAVQALAFGRDWYYPDSTWRLLLDVGEIHGVSDERGDLLTTATLVSYGNELAAVGMVLTDPRFEGRGLGRRVMQRVLDRAGDTPVLLYATEQGRPLYEKLGFAALASNTIYEGLPKAGADRPLQSRAATPADIPAMLDLDRRALGADRSDLVVRLFGYTEQLRVIERDGEVVGYGASWRTVNKLALGPVLAVESADATALLDDLAALSRGRVRLEAHSERPALHAWADERGLDAGSDLTVMATDQLPTGNWNLWHAPMSLATG